MASRRRVYAWSCAHEDIIAVFHEGAKGCFVRIHSGSGKLRVWVSQRRLAPRTNTGHHCKPPAFAALRQERDSIGADLLHDLPGGHSILKTGRWLPNLWSTLHVPNFPRFPPRPSWLMHAAR